MENMYAALSQKHCSNEGACQMIGVRTTVQLKEILTV